MALTAMHIGKGDKWRDIIDKYCTRVKHLGRSANHTVVVFHNGYENSTKYKTHRRRQKQFCHGIKIREDLIPYTTKGKFRLNSSNKSALVSMISKNLTFPTFAAFAAGMMQTQQL